MPGTLFLLPNVMGDQQHAELVLPASIGRAVVSLDGLIAESESGGRRFLSRFETTKPPHLIPIALFNEHTPDGDIDFLLEPMSKGEARWGLVSDAGVPCIADPGSKLVSRARDLGIRIQAFAGPSSIVIALMLAGLPAQRFAFHGYLSKEQRLRQDQIKTIEARSARDDATQLFIEVPYRNKHLLEQLVATLHDETHLCVAWDLTLPTQGILSQPVRTWKKSPLPVLDKKPAIFLIYA